MKRIITLLLCILSCSMLLAQKYTASGKLLYLYADDLEQAIVTLPGETTMEIKVDNHNGDTRWAKVVTDTDPVYTGWVDTYFIKQVADESQESDIAISDFTPSTELMKLGALLLVMSPVYVFMLCFFIFLIMFVFKFGKLTAWFDRKAGMNISPTNRLDKSLWRALPLLVIFGATLALVSERQDVMTALAGLAVMAVYAIVMVSNRAKIYGSRRAARWQVLYTVMAALGIVSIGIILWWGVLLYIGFKFVHTFVTAPNLARCKDCGYCERYIGGNIYCTCHKDRLVEVDLRDEACEHFYRR